MTAPDPSPRPAKRQPAKKGQHPVPKRQKTGYYADHSTGDRLRSVTTILGGGVPKPSLIFWAANTCTDEAIEALPMLVAASRNRERLEELRAWIRRAHTRKKDERADIGSAVHKLVECHILGQPVPDELLDDPEMAPYLANFLRFAEEWDVAFTASEMVVANYTSQYAGTLDFMIRSEPLYAALRAKGYEVSDDVDLMGDTKTGGEWDRVTSAGHVHGVYPEAGLQMSAYRRGEMCWLRDGSKVPMPPTAEVGIVLHLKAEGYRVYPARCGDDVFPYFQHAQMVDEFTSKVASAKADAPVIGAALTLPAPTARKDVA